MSSKLEEAALRANWITSYRHYLGSKGFDSLYNIFESEDAYETGKSPREAGDEVIERNKASDVLVVDEELNRQEENEEERDTIQ